ncbi:hypothetical protein [Azohydromonas lata]|uniref:Uncharacterized protein n=1 Tax=Azohydromonas lata TaxID=45677 RepID=A0ABU5ID88_9BURK|nr:hypothetical protein [Azohydromonas lata]MDZ5457081.1 hypothetical protein [Azohydromonas lata]
MNISSHSVAWKSRAAAPQAPLSGEVLGKLINLSGRRRFTSQCLVLYAVLAHQGKAGALEISREAPGIFETAHASLVQGGDGLPGLYCEALRSSSS